MEKDLTNPKECVISSFRSKQVYCCGWGITYVFDKEKYPFEKSQTSGNDGSVRLRKGQKDLHRPILFDFFESTSYNDGAFEMISIEKMPVEIMHEQRDLAISKGFYLFYEDEDVIVLGSIPTKTRNYLKMYELKEIL